MRHLILSMTLAGLLTGCAVSSPPPRPAMDLATDWTLATATADPSLLLQDDWWLAFDSEPLQQLIEQALQQNLDLRMAQERILQAEAQLGITRASSLPGLNANASAGVRNTSGNNGQNTSSESSSIGLSTSYEVDLWGRIAAERAAGKASLEATVYDWHSTRLSLSASVASSWFQWLLLDSRQETARWYLQAAEKQLAFIEAAYQQGTATPADLARQRSQVISQQSNLKNLQHQQLQTSNALALLLGEAPQQFQPPTADLQQLNPPRIHPGLPSDLLTRRPDLARAEAQLQAAEANITAARAAVFPSLQLSASAALASSTLSLADPVQTLNLTSGITQSIFDHGVRKRQIQISESRQQELLQSYHKAVLTALIEVEDALSNERLNHELQQQQQRLVKETRLITSHTERRYQAGADSLNLLLEAQRSLFQAEDQLLQLQQERLNASLNLYRVLGGGWQQENVWTNTNEKD
ncbi:MAG: efflux transporter outer membrane subunit [Marinospirillum sp.]|uniref:efflux transporter outer membrane subunit n=1 Tax=Marinospirillum sp. TaxID=2183934 RepID=UPI0019E4862F|nr:efflux transporter outer membrane subunit [Marinospirillum sp.]MBE0507177.1 efflux transporter outer membrane subunit [Marinospirillum sp.]